MNRQDAIVAWLERIGGTPVSAPDAAGWVVGPASAARHPYDLKSLDLVKCRVGRKVEIHALTCGDITGATFRWTLTLQELDDGWTVQSGGGSGGGSGAPTDWNKPRANLSWSWGSNLVTAGGWVEGAGSGQVTKVRIRAGEWVQEDSVERGVVLFIAEAAELPIEQPVIELYAADGSAAWYVRLLGSKHHQEQPILSNNLRNPAKRRPS